MVENKYNYVDGMAEVNVFDPEMELWFTGLAMCSKDDKDFENELTGYEIAEARAALHYCKTAEKFYKGQRKALQNLLNVYEGSTRCNSDTTNAYFEILRKQIYVLDVTIEDAKETYKEIKEGIDLYIEQKDNLYNQLRKARLTKED